MDVLAPARSLLPSLALGSRLLALVLVAGCIEGDARVEVELPVESDTGLVRDGGALSLAAGDARPATMEGTLVLEGEEHSALFRLFRSPAGFVPGFSTYLPPGITAVAESADSLRFVFGDGHEPAPVLEVTALPAGLDEARARRRAVAGAHDGESPRERPELLPGSVTSWLISRDGRSGRIDLVSHDGRFVVLHLHYPPEYGDGVEPRMAAIRDAWIWTDGSQPLVQGLARLPEDELGDTVRDEPGREVEPGAGGFRG